MPAAAHTARPSATEKAVQAGVVRALRAMGFVVNDMSQPRATKQAPGVPDLYAQHPAWGIRLWVEVKAARGRVRHAQQRWHEAERAAGGAVVVARSAADLLAPLRALGAPIE